MTDPDYTTRTIILMAEKAAETGLPHIGACPFSWKWQPENMKLWMDSYRAKLAEMEAEGQS